MEIASHLRLRAMVSLAPCQSFQVITREVILVIRIGTSIFFVFGQVSQGYNCNYIFESLAEFLV